MTREAVYGWGVLMRNGALLKRQECGDPHHSHRSMVTIARTREQARRWAHDMMLWRPGRVVRVRIVPVAAKRRRNADAR